MLQNPAFHFGEEKAISSTRNAMRALLVRSREDDRQKRRTGMNGLRMTKYLTCMDQPHA